jgi:hypothetical protein
MEDNKKINKGLVNKLFSVELKIRDNEENMNKMVYKTNLIMMKMIEMENKLSRKLFEYPLEKITNLLSISENFKDKIKNSISNIYIYSKGSTLSQNLIIQYHFDNKFCEFKTKSNTNEMKSFYFENGLPIDIYNLKYEFTSLTFRNLKYDRFLENYVYLIIKNKESKKGQLLGLILLGYYYLLFFLCYVDTSQENVIVMNHPKVKQLQKIFMGSHKNYITDGYDKGLKDIQEADDSLFPPFYADDSMQNDNGMNNDNNIILYNFGLGNGDNELINYYHALQNDLLRQIFYSNLPTDAPHVNNRSENDSLPNLLNLINLDNENDVNDANSENNPNSNAIINVRNEINNQINNEIHQRLLSIIKEKDAIIKKLMDKYNRKD